jgi:hypothetical protein
MRGLFTVEERDRVRAILIEKARADPRIAAGAEIGALAKGTADRWSDLDLTFGLADGVAVDEALDGWTADLGRDLHASHLFDLPVPPTLYRVFLLPSNLQIDVSFTPGTEVIGRGMKHTVLFGEMRERDRAAPRSVEDIYGWAVHHALRARFSIERERWWQAEYWVDELRYHALMLACRRRGLEGAYGRGFDELPADVHGVAEGALVRSLDRADLMRALNAGIGLLLRESADLGERATQLEPQLLELASE